MNITRLIAREAGILLDDIHMGIHGDIDPSRAFGLDGNTRAGFSDLSVALALVPGISDNDRELLLNELVRRCPLCDTINNPMPLKITIE